MANGNAIGIAGQHLVALRKMVVAKNAANACLRIGEAKVAKDVEDFAPSLWCGPLREAPVCNRRFTIRSPGAQQPSVFQRMRRHINCDKGLVPSGDTSSSCKGGRL